MSNSMHHYGLQFASHGLSIAILSPFFQLFGEILYWLKHGIWFNFSFFDLFEMRPTHPLFNTSFLGFNALAQFVCGLWIAVPVGVASLLGFLILLARQFSGFHPDRPLSFEQHIYWRNEVLENFGELASRVAQTSRELRELQNSVSFVAADIRNIDKFLDDQAARNSAEEFVRHIDEVKEKLERLERDVNDIGSRALSCSRTTNWEET